MGRGWRISRRSSRCQGLYGRLPQIIHCEKVGRAFRGGWRHKIDTSMTRNQLTRYAAIMARFRHNYGPVSADTWADALQGASRYLRAMAKSTLPLESILSEMDNSQSQGWAVPAIRLGVVRAPKRGGCYMADVRRVSYRLSAADVREQYGPLAKQ